MFGREYTRLVSYLAMAAMSLVYGPMVLPAFAEDTAVVVGINTYPHLNNANLSGCVADAQSIKAMLEKRGFKVILLTEEQATKQGILKTLTNVQSTIHSEDRFVFYFAGHGSHDDSYRCMLLTADAEESNFDHTLNKDDLTAAISAIPTQKRTVLLDACHSEGLFRAKSLVHFRSRYHRLRASQGKSKSLPNINQTDNNDDLMDKGFCSFAACLRNQVAGELDFGNDTHGIFTYYLTSLLNSAPSDVSWDDTVSKVAAQVADKMEQQQTPVFAPNAYRNHRVFDGRGDKKEDPTPGPRTLWEDFVDTKANAKYIKVMVDPNSAHFQIGEKFDVKLEVGADGYLVVLNKDLTGKVFLFSPNSLKSANVDELVHASHVEAGMTRTIHTQGKDGGTEWVKAILFSSEAEARSLLEKFPRDGATTSQLKDINRLRSITNDGETDRHDGEAWSYYTSEVHVDILPAGGTPDGDPDKSAFAPAAPFLPHCMRKPHAEGLRVAKVSGTSHA